MPDQSTTTTLWLVGLSSAALSTVISGIVVGLFNLRAKRNEFVNDYHKAVIQRRIQAYESLEKLVILIKTAVVDRDNRPYHLIFSQENPRQTVYERIFELMLHGLWLSKKAFEKTREFNLLMFSLSEDSASAIEFGKAHYEIIARLREDLETALADDMGTLYDVKGFLKSKRGQRFDFHPVRLQHPPEPKSGGQQVGTPTA